MPGKPEWIVIRNQISKSGTSICANYREANHAKSKSDFKYKIIICEGEASETIYWLEIIQEAKMKNIDGMYATYKEAEVLLALFVTIGKNTKL